MTVPAAVLKQAEEADRMMDEFQKANEGKDTVVETTAQTEVVADTTPSEEALESSTQLETVSKDDYTKLQADFEKLQHTYKSLLGRIESRESRAAQSENDRLRNEIRILSERLDTLTKQPAASSEPEKPAYLRHIDEDEIKDIDQSVLDLQGRMAKGVAESEVAKVRQETQKIKDELGSKVDEIRKHIVEDKTRQLWAEVDKVHPGASLMDSSQSPEWIEFLNTSDELTGEKYFDVGIKAISQSNANRIIKLIDKFKATNGANSANLSLIGQIKPKTSSVETGSKQPQKQIFKESEMNNLVKEITQGLWRNRRLEAEEKMNLFQDAALNGRMLYGQ